jgi:oxygen-independent coproporphyrinogen-3 oxidase
VQLTGTSQGQQTPAVESDLTHPLTGPVAERAARLYIHVPFCFHKCHYCDFYSLVDQRDRQAEFTDRLIDELLQLARFARPLRTIFVGGGTPTLLHVEHWTRLLEVLRRRFSLDALEEFTVECNPETADAGLFSVLRDGGVNRLSIGAQSFVRRHLETLERWHDPASVPRALELARDAEIHRLSLDLIYAIPGQTIDDWQSDLRTSLQLGVDHMSCYNLTYEEGTAMTARLRHGQVKPLSDDVEAAMFECTNELLDAAGLQRYEVSNYAKPGQECRHNLGYWRCEPYLAAGPSASGHLGGWRWRNVPHLGRYLASSGLAPVEDVEIPDATRYEAERLMLGVRLAEGVALEPGAAQSHQIRELAREGKATLEGGRLRLTAAGMLWVDDIAERLMPDRPDVV